MKRLKSLVYTLICLGICCACIVGVWIFARDAARLASHGKQTTGKIVKYESRESHGRRGRVNHHYEHTVLYDGHEKMFDLDQELSVGQRVYVLYLPREPELARITKIKGSMWRLFSEDMWWTGWLMLPLFILFGYLGIAHGHDIFFSSEAEGK